MVARLFFPAFTKRRSATYHRYLAQVVEIGNKAANPEFRTRSTVRHMEDFSELCSSNVNAGMVQSVRTGMAFAAAVQAGYGAFWGSMFGAMAQTTARFAEVFQASGNASLLILGRSDDDRVLSVQFRNRILTDRALEGIRVRRSAGAE
jgi:hypothetical protein